MDVYTLTKKVIKKLAQTEQINKRQALEIIYEFADKEEVIEPKYEKEMKINEEQHTKLRSLYDLAPVKKLYTYSLGRFGFELEGLRLDVEPANLKIKKLGDE